jgi:hypothetical protein
MKLVMVATASAMLVGVMPGQQKLRDIAAETGGDVKNSISQEFAPSTVAQLVERSDVIVQGVVASVTSHLDPSEQVVVTDTTLNPIRFYKQRIPVAFAERPAQTAKLVVRHAGGTVVDGPYRLTTVADQYGSSQDFQPGEEVILFLRQNKEDGVFNLSSGPFGAFRIKGEAVEALTKEAAHERGDRPKSRADFLNELQGALASGR